MRVEDLIEQLQNCPKDYEVCLEIGGKVYGVTGAVELLGADIVDLSTFEYEECDEYA